MTVDHVLFTVVMSVCRCTLYSAMTVKCIVHSSDQCVQVCRAGELYLAQGELRLGLEKLTSGQAENSLTV